MTTYNVEMDDAKWARVKLGGMPLERQRALYKALSDEMVKRSWVAEMSDAWRRVHANKDREFHGERIAERARVNGQPRRP